MGQPLQYVAHNVLYRPEAPATTALIDDRGALWGTSLLAGLFACVFALGGSRYHLAGWRNQLKWFATTAGLWVMRLDQCQQTAPRYHLLHLGQETLATGLLALTGVLAIGKAHLTHGMGSL